MIQNRDLGLIRKISMIRGRVSRHAEIVLVSLFPTDHGNRHIAEFGRDLSGIDRRRIHNQFPSESVGFLAEVVIDDDDVEAESGETVPNRGIAYGCRQRQIGLPTRNSTSLGSPTTNRTDLDLADSPTSSVRRAMTLWTPVGAFAR